jgi:DNA-binding NtrC family response regulator
MTEELTLVPQASHRCAASYVPHREAAGKRVIFVVEDDWRTRHFICTVLKYSANALIIESSNPQEALVRARELAYRIDLLISNIDSKTGMDFVHEMVANNPSTGVLLMSGRETLPCDIPRAWRFLSIPFLTAAFLDCVSELCGDLDQPK